MLAFVPTTDDNVTAVLTEGIKTGDSGSYSPLLFCTLRWMWIDTSTQTVLPQIKICGFSAWTSQAFPFVGKLRSIPVQGCKYSRVTFGGCADFDKLQPFLLFP